jgi:hypothetical protein
VLTNKLVNIQAETNLGVCDYVIVGAVTQIRARSTASY